MKNRTITFMLSAAVAVMLMLVAPAGAQAFQDCSPSELEIGTCTPLTYLNATPTGYVLRLPAGYPLYNESTDQTTFLYEVSLAPGYSPHGLSHADLEFKICDGSGCSAVAATANGAPTGYTQIAAGTGGDPSTRSDPDCVGYGAFLASDLVKINLPSLQNGTFAVTVAGKAYATMGKIGFKAGQDIMVGNILLPVCSASCSQVKFSAFAKRTVVTETGYEFDIISNESTGCSIVTEFRNPLGEVQTLNQATLGEFFGTSKDGDDFTLENISSDENCLNLVVDDTEEHSPAYCSGGWCWY